MYNRDTYPGMVGWCIYRVYYPGMVGWCIYRVYIAQYTLPGTPYPRTALPGTLSPAAAWRREESLGSRREKPLGESSLCGLMLLMCLG